MSCGIGRVCDFVRHHGCQLGVDQRIAKRAGLLHNIGKALDHQLEGTHISIGVDYLKKYNEPEAVINAIEAHQTTWRHARWKSLVQRPNALSAARRPVAKCCKGMCSGWRKWRRSPSHLRGLKRPLDSSGAGIRVIVTPDKVQDSEAIFLAQDIAKKIERNAPTQATSK